MKVRDPNGTVHELPDDATEADIATITGERVLERGTGFLANVDAAVRGAADTLTFGTMDEIAAGLSSLTGLGDQGGGYEGNLQAQRAIDRFDEEQNPYARLGGQIAGGVAGAVGAGAVLPSARAVTLPGRMAAGALEGGVAGGAYGFGSGEGGPGNRVMQMPEGAATGAAFGAGGAVVGEGIDRAARWGLNRLGFEPPGPPAPPPGQEFGIDLRRGQLPGASINQAQFEQDVLQGARGETPRRILSDHEAMQQAQIAQAGENIAGRLAAPPGTHLPTVPGGFPGAAAAAPLATRNVQELGEMSLQAVRDAEQASQRGINQAYDAARAAGGVASTDAIQVAPQAVRAGVESRGFIVNDQLTPYAARTLADLDEFGQLGGVLRNDASFTRPGPDDRVAGVTLDGVEAMRRRILQAQQNATLPEDRRATRAMLQSFDGWLDEAGDRGLLEGSEDGLELWKKARATRREHGARFESNPRQRDDDSGRLIEKMISKDVGSNEVVNAILGASKAGENGVSTRLIRRLQMVLPDSDMGTIRQMAWERTLQSASGSPDKPAGPRAVATAIERMLEGQGRSFAQTLYTQEQRDLMRRYARVLRLTEPPPRTVNTSNSGGVVARAQQTAQALWPVIGASLLGASQGGIGMGLAGGAVGVGAVGGRLAWNAVRARNATRPRNLPAGPVMVGPSFAPVRPGAAYGAGANYQDEPQQLRIRAPGR